MPCWILVCTSIGFAIPSLIAAKLRKKKDKKMLGSLSITSVLYHGTVHPLAKFIDTCVAHYIAIRYMFHGIRRIISYKNIYDVVGVAIGGASIYMYYHKSLRIKDHRESQKWHAAVHITAQAAMTIFLYSPSNVLSREEI